MVRISGTATLYLFQQLLFLPCTSSFDVYLECRFSCLLKSLQLVFLTLHQLIQQKAFPVGQVRKGTHANWFLHHQEQWHIVYFCSQILLSNDKTRSEGIPVKSVKSLNFQFRMRIWLHINWEYCSKMAVFSSKKYCPYYKPPGILKYKKTFSCIALLKCKK